MNDENNKSIENTLVFFLKQEFDKKKLKKVYNALLEKNYDPINQIAGYILSGDPTYITTHKNARKIIQDIDRCELLKKLIRDYVE
ncbi:MAG: IreB family regulatory phosphoprotein [Clostridia bacterium]|nr:IreB family regulatory phosphoprotein [Clostridia bacterium]